MKLKCGSLKVMEKQYTAVHLRINRQKDQKLKKVTTILTTFQNGTHLKRDRTN